MKQYQLSGKEVKKLAEQYGFIGRKSRIEVQEADNKKLYFVDKKLVLIEKQDIMVPSLKTESGLPLVTVDMGAVKFVAKGADVMRPGITKIDEFEKGALVVVVDEKNQKPLAICQALFSSGEMKQMTQGKVLRNLHYVGDDYWKQE
ncbi:MAG: DUF1947 domain-containing protein [DPANN group archaeon]|nr:DUF1947 domain-containing protein [DPANN group archaeon]